MLRQIIRDGPPRRPRRRKDMQSRPDLRIDRGLAMTQDLGGYPGEMVSMVSIWGTELG